MGSYPRCAPRSGRCGCREGVVCARGDLAAWVRNYAARGREGAIYGRAILLGLGALEWEERAQCPTLWRFVTLYSIVSQTDTPQNRN
jgi:hypothetical protein